MRTNAARPSAVREAFGFVVGLLVALQIREYPVLNKTRFTRCVRPLRNLTLRRYSTALSGL